jgi:hypothetical protein
MSNEKNERPCPQRQTFELGTEGDSLFLLAMLEWRVAKIEKEILQHLSKTQKGEKKNARRL